MISSENPREIAHIAEIMMKEIDILNEKICDLYRRLKWRV